MGDSRLNKKDLKSPLFDEWRRKKAYREGEVSLTKKLGRLECFSNLHLLLYIVYNDKYTNIFVKKKTSIYDKGDLVHPYIVYNDLVHQYIWDGRVTI